MAAIAAAVAEGELSIGEAESAAKLVELFVRSFEVGEICNVNALLTHTMSHTRARISGESKSQTGPKFRQPGARAVIVHSQLMIECD
jgi:hypothetical protein